LIAVALNISGGQKNVGRARVAGGTGPAQRGRVDSLGRNLVVIGLLIAFVGAVLWIFGRHGGGLLPGDIVVERKNVRFYFPIVTCLVVSAILSLVTWWLRR